MTRHPVRFAAVLLLAFVVSASQGEAQVTDTAGTLRVPDAAQFVGEPQGVPLTGDALNIRTHEVGQLLRCPVCQGMAVSDSPAEMAVNMKHQVRELLERGYTEEQILRYFELSYGQFVLLKPKFEGVVGMVWVLPVIGLLVGALVLFLKFRKLDKDPESVASREVVPGSDPDDMPAADPYVARVREMVSGGKR
jgi:cytochrome c-type biogenesis protein CcmH